MQKRVNTAGLTAILGKVCCKIGPWLASGNFDFRSIPTINLSEWLTVPKLYKQYG